jgi:uncharacterized protein
MAETIKVQVCYAMPGVQVLRDLTVASNTTLQQAVKQSGVLQDFPEIDLAANRVGIFGKLKPLDASLREHDRIEIYRPLIAEPKEARRRRVAKGKGKE